MGRAILVLLACLAAASAAGQTVGPQTDPASPVAVRADGPRRFELGFVYGFAAFTSRHADAAWYAGAPVSGDMDLQTTATLGLDLAWSAAENLRIGLRTVYQGTRLEVGGPDGIGRSDLDLLHAQLAVEAAFGGGRLRPVLGLAGGGVLASADGTSTWHYSATPACGVRFAPDPRVVLRLLARVPLIWAGGTLVPQLEFAGGVAVPF